jgi:hypothetical protein
MVETKYQGLGVHINVEPAWISQELKGKVQVFLGQLPPGIQDYQTIDRLVREQNAQNTDNINVFYWDNKRNFIFGYVFKDDDVYRPEQSHLLSLPNRTVYGNKITDMHMHREFSGSKGALTVKSPKKPVLQMLNCFDSKFNESLGHYLSELPLDDRLDLFNMYFKNGFSNPVVALHYVADGKHLKTFRNEFKETVQKKDLL